MTHEELTRKHAVRGSSDRAFGLVFFVFFTLAGLAPLCKHQPLRIWSLTLSGLFLAAAILRPVWLHPLNQAWMKLGLVLSRVVSPIVVGLLFLVVVVPTAFIFRLLGKDPLRLARNATVPSYWIERRPAGPLPQTMTNQF